MSDFENFLYPKSHLWGYPYDASNKSCVLNPLYKNFLVRLLSALYSVFTKNRLGDFLVEFSLLCRLREYSCIYCVSGKLFWLPILKRLGLIDVKLIILIYRIPNKSPMWKLHDLHHSKFILGSYDGINCLTQKTENQIKNLLPNNSNIRFLAWCTDSDFFSPEKNQTSNYLFSAGKTNRDYKTLILAARKNIRIKFIVIGHFDDELMKIVPSNMKVINSNTYQTDSAISYNELKSYYSKASAICIPLNEDPNDTCGYTELLEAMAMGKPILKTRTGCLDINIEKERIGYFVEPHNPEEWDMKIRLLFSNLNITKRMGQNSRLLIEKNYNIKSYTQRVADFIEKVNGKST